jgi:glycosyltransferase involved in cell wall biosynthesis
MRACSVFVLPSRFEGLGCVYLEAMACGKPVIACRAQGIEEIIDHGKNGWLISDWVNSETTNSEMTNSDTTNSPGALNELVHGLSTLLGSPELCSLLGTAARNTILNRLTLSHQAERLAQIYSEAIAASVHSS